MECIFLFTFSMLVCLFYLDQVFLMVMILRHAFWVLRCWRHYSLASQVVQSLECLQCLDFILSWKIVAIVTEHHACHIVMRTTLATGLEMLDQNLGCVGYLLKICYWPMKIIYLPRLEKHLPFWCIMILCFKNSLRISISQKEH